MRLHVQELGSGSPVVMAHGLFVGTLASWYFTAAPVLARRHRVLLYDLRGHGLSERTRTGYDLATLSDDLAALVTAFTEAPVALVGHSYGGLVALRFALRFPERVSRLALVEAPLPPARFAELSDFLAQDPRAMLESLPEPLRAAAERGRRSGQRMLATVEFLATQSTLLADLRGEQDVPDALLAKLQCPVLCVYGEQSPCRSVGERLARVVPDARLASLPGGHYLPVESPAAVTRRLDEFLRA